MEKNIQNKLSAEAHIRGGHGYPDIRGRVVFRQLASGVLVTAQIYGLPFDGDCSFGIFAFHIHSGKSCSGGAASFPEAEGHYNPKDCPHPYHAGDLPPLFGCRGYAYLSVFTDRFTVREIIGRVIIIHDSPDDFKTQPAGDSGNKIACGEIRPAAKK